MQLLSSVPEDTLPPQQEQDTAETSTEQQGGEEVKLRGVIFSKSVRAFFCSLHVAALVKDAAAASSTDNDDDDEDNCFDLVMVRIQFEDRELRSFCRRFLKLGDLVTISDGQWTSNGGDKATGTDARRFVVNITSVEHATLILNVEKARYWSVGQYQKWQKEYLPAKVAPVCSNRKTAKDVASASEKCNHSGGLEKRQQGIFVANFLVNMLLSQMVAESDFAGPEEWAKLDSDGMAQSFPHLVEKRQRVIDKLNQGTGVVDAAGGSGHVSMALAMMNIQATVVDPRESVGKLPGRDRKTWNRALRNMQTCQPIKQYNSMRAWIGKAPPQLRTTDQEDVPVCSDTSALIQSASALVALHPDEATDFAVDIAVARGIPFVIVPCCVFARYFPNRRYTRADGSVGGVSTHLDLVEYLSHKDNGIQRAILPFIGANTVLWKSYGVRV